MECNYCTEIAKHFFKEGENTWYHWNINEEGQIIDPEPDQIDDINEIPEVSEVYTCDKHTEEMGAGIGFSSETLID